MKEIKIFNKASVALGLLQLGFELAHESRGRFSQLDIEVLDIENCAGVACQTIRIRGFLHPGSKAYGNRDASTTFRSDVQLVCVYSHWCVSSLWLYSGLIETTLRCEYVNLPSSGNFYYPSHLCILRKDGEKAWWDVMDTDSCEIKSLAPGVLSKIHLIFVPEK